MNNVKSFLKKAWPIIFAAGLAAIQAINEQSEADRIDDMEERLKYLERREESSDE